MDRWPLVGRASEIEALGVALRGSGGVVVAGPAGVGKTRLAREVAERGDSEAIWITASTATQPIPFGALAALFDSDASGSPLDVTRQLVAKLGATDRLVVVDDAHLLDDLSVVVLQQLSGSTTPLLLTVRTPPAVTGAVVDLWKDGALDRVDIAPLGESDSRDLLEQVLSGSLEELSFRRLWQTTGGNVLHLKEIVLDATDQGALDERDGLWRLDATFQPGGRLVDLVGRRVAHLDRGGQAALELLAVAGAVELVLLDELVTTDVLAELEAERLLSVDDRNLARLAYPVYGDVIETELGAVRRRELLRLLTEAARKVGHQDDSSLVRLARWWLESGLPPDADLFLDATSVALGRQDHRLAEGLARAALEAGTDQPARAATSLAAALLFQKRNDEAAELLLPMVTGMGNDADRARLAVALAEGLALETGRFSGAVELLERLETELPEGGPRELARAQRATLLAFSGDYEEALVLVEPILAGFGLAEPARLRALSPAALAWSLDGRTDRAIAETRASLGPAWEQMDELPRAVGWIASAHLVALLENGALDEVEAFISMLGDVEGNDTTYAFLSLIRGRLEVSRGRPARAARHLLEALGLMRRTDPVLFLPWCLAELAMAQASMGDAVAARLSVAEAVEVRAPDAHLSDAVIARCEVWTVAAEGDRTAAADLAKRGAAALREQGLVGAEAHLLHDAARFGDAAAVSDRLGTLRDSVDGRWIRPYAAHAEALASRDAEGLELVAQDFDAIGARLLAARALVEAAVQHRSDGQFGRSEAVLSRARQAYEWCEGASIPPELEVHGATRLTARERQVVELAAAGASNREIAERLVVSVRTVEGHLLRAGQKLGVSGRDELRAVFAKNA